MCAPHTQRSKSNKFESKKAFEKKQQQQKMAKVKRGVSASTSLPMEIFVILCHRRKLNKKKKQKRPIILLAFCVCRIFDVINTHQQPTEKIINNNKTRRTMSPFDTRQYTPE